MKTQGLQLICEQLALQRLLHSEHQQFQQTNEVKSPKIAKPSKNETHQHGICKAFINLKNSIAMNINDENLKINQSKKSINQSIN